MDNKNIQSAGFPEKQLQRGIRSSLLMNLRILWITALSILLFVLEAAAAPVVIRSFTQEGNPALMWYVRDVEGTVDSESSTVSVGEHEGEIESFGKLQELGGVIYKTVILIDNSASISYENQTKAKQLACALIDQHTANEEFVIYTIDTELHNIGEGTDYEQLKDQVNAIVHNNQDEYLVEGLAQVLDENREDGAGYYDRIVMISDGKDDNSEGRTYEELRKDLEDDDYRCPIYTAACIWNQDRSGLKELRALAEVSNGSYFVLDEYDDPAQIAEEINASDYTADYFTINIPIEEKDGEKKDVTLSLVTSEGTQTLTRSVEGLVRTPQEEAELTPETELQTETEEVTEAVTEKKEEDIVLIPETEEETEADKKDDSFIKKHWYLIPLGIALAVLIAVIVVLLIRRKKSKVWDDEKFYEQYYQQHPDQNERRTLTDLNSRGSAGGVSAGSGQGMPGYARQQAPADSTVSMWGLEQQQGSVRVVLEDMKNPREQYSFVLSGETVVGRSGDCAVVIATDKSVSKRHLRLMPWQGEVVVEDLGSTNGTSINGKRISTMQQLRSNDILGIGNKQMRVYIS